MAQYGLLDRQPAYGLGLLGPQPAQGLVNYDPADAVRTTQEFMANARPPPSLLTSMGVSDRFNDALFRSKLAQFAPGLLGDAMSAFTLPGDAYAGRVDPMSNAGVDRAIGLAAMMTTGGGVSPAAIVKETPELLASRSARLYNPPVKSPRSFADDYPGGAPADEAGNLVRDIEGRPLQPTATVVGRRVVGGEDVPLLPSQYDALTAGSIGAVPAAVEARALPRGSVGAYRVSYDADGKTVRDIGVLKDLPADAAVKVTAHEMGHMIDDLARKLASDPGIPQKLIKKELRDNFHVLNDTSWRRLQENVRPGLQTSPESLDYAKGAATDRELMAEAVRAYMADPNYFKTVAPETAKRIRAAVNDNPRLSKVIQFNAGGSPIPAALAATAASQMQPAQPGQFY